MGYRAYRLKLKESKIKEYVDYHKKEKIWKSVIEGLINSGCEEMIIFLLDNEIVLFERAENLKDMSKFLASDPESIRWQKVMNEMFDSSVEFDIEKGDLEIEEVPIVFYLKGKTLLH